MREILLIIHPAFGILGVLAAVWIFVEVLNISERNLRRIQIASYCVNLFIFLTYIFGGYWYVVHYGMEKALIKSGPWAFSHWLFMETKEHLFFTLLLLAFYLPIIAVQPDLLERKSNRILLLTCSGLIIILGLCMDGMGAVISGGVKTAFLGS